MARKCSDKTLTAAMGRADKHFYEFGPFRLDIAEHLLLRDGQPVQLMPKAFDALLLMVQKSGDLVAKEEFIREVWQGAAVGDDSLARIISVLRKALGDDAGEHQYIKTVHRLGYRFVAHVEEKWDEDGKPGVSASPDLPTAEPRRKWMTWSRNPRLIVAITLTLLTLISVVIWLAIKDGKPQSSNLELNQPVMKQISSGVSSATRPMISPDGKVVLYVSDGDIYIAPAAGGDVLRVTNNAQASGDMLVFTADGASIVFSRYRGGEDGSRLPDLWIVPSLGGTPRLFIAEAAGAGFSPDGKRVAYTKYFTDKKPLWISPMDRLEEHREVSDLGFTPRWSPDGKWIAYTTSNPRGDDGVLWIVSASLTERRQVTKEPQVMYGLTWSADGRSLIFALGSSPLLHLYQLSVANGLVKPLTVGVGDYASPSVSPDGETLIFCHASQARDLVMAEGVGNPEVKNITEEENHLWPRLSPSGKRVASVAKRPDFDEHLYVTDLETRKSTRVSDRIAHHPCWLTEDRLAYLSFDASAQKTEARVVSLSTSVNSAWTQFHGKAEWLAVHPDQKRIAIVLKSPEGRQKLAIRDLEKRTDLTLTEGAEYEELRWLPDGSALSWSGPAFSGGAVSNGVWVIEPGQERPRRLAPDGYGPVWSPDSESVWFSRSRSSLWRLDVRRNVLTKVRSWGFVHLHDLVGERLVFTPISNRSQIYSMPLDK